MEVSCQIHASAASTSRKKHRHKMVREIEVVWMLCRKTRTDVERNEPSPFSAQSVILMDLLFRVAASRRIRIYLSLPLLLVCLSELWGIHYH